jgi:ABC-type cobalamin/Fe3+-siderophores transport system ATPase subunit
VLVEWARAGFGLQRAAVAIESAQLAAGFGLAAWLLWTRLDRGAEPGALLLLTYWALNLPVLGQQIAQLAWQYPAHRNVLLRLLEPLGAIDEAPAEMGTGEIFAPSPSKISPVPISGAGVAIACDEVTVVAGGHPILRDITIRIASGTHVAIVGASPEQGSRASSGCCSDGIVPRTAASAWTTRRSMVRRSSGCEARPHGSIRRCSCGIDRSSTTCCRHRRQARAAAPAIHAADLRDVLRSCRTDCKRRSETAADRPGGEGAARAPRRALLRPDARLVILDEPFRGLERERRRDLLRRTRGVWRHATLLCITHDVSETLAFDRVIVLSDAVSSKTAHRRLSPRRPDRSTRDARLGRDGARGAVDERALADAAARARTRGRRGRGAGDAVIARDALDGGLWPMARAGDAIEALARGWTSASFGHRVYARPRGSTRPVDAQENWLQSVAAQLGVEIEPIDARYAQIDRVIRRSPPSLLRVNIGARTGLLAIVKGWAPRVAVLGPDRHVRSAPIAAVRAAVCEPLELPLQAETERLLDTAAVPESRRPRVRQAILRERLAARRLATAGWFASALRAVRCADRTRADRGAARGARRGARRRVHVVGPLVVDRRSHGPRRPHLARDRLRARRR